MKTSQAKVVGTERLIVRKFSEGDETFIVKLVNSKTWLENIGDRGIYDFEAARRYLNQSILKSYEENGYGLYLMELKDTNEPIGMCGFLKRNCLPNADLGFAVLPEYARQGYTYEAATSLLQNVNLTFECIYAITNQTNRASRTLLEKLKFKFDKLIVVDGEELGLYERKLE